MPSEKNDGKAPSHHREEGPAPLLYYATRYWPAHFVKARSGGTNNPHECQILQDVKKFLESESHLVTWLEFSFDFNREMGDPEDALASIVAMSENLRLPPDPEESSNHYSKLFADA